MNDFENDVFELLNSIVNLDDHSTKDAIWHFEEKINSFRNKYQKEFEAWRNKKWIEQLLKEREVQAEICNKIKCYRDDCEERVKIKKISKPLASTEMRDFAPYRRGEHLKTE